MPYDEFAEIRDMQNKLFKANLHKLIADMSNLADFMNKTPTCPKCKVEETLKVFDERFQMPKEPM